MTGETDVAKPQEATRVKGPLIKEFGGEVRPETRRANKALIEKYLGVELSYEGFAHLGGMTTVTPTETKWRGYWGKRPLRSVSFLSFASDNPPVDEGTDSRLQLQSVGRLSYQFEKGGNVREALAVLSEEGGRQIIVKVTRGYSIPVEGRDDISAVPVLVVDRKIAGQKGIDRIVIAACARESVSEAVTWYFNQQVERVAGEGRVVSDKKLNALAHVGNEDGIIQDRDLESFTNRALVKNASKRPLHIFRVLSHLGKNRAAKRAN